LTGDKDREELAWVWEVEADDVDERESDLPLFPALGVISISYLSCCLVYLDQYHLFDYLMIVDTEVL
jgi:hypothetical protein